MTVYHPTGVRVPQVPIADIAQLVEHGPNKAGVGGFKSLYPLSSLDKTLNFFFPIALVAQ